MRNKQSLGVAPVQVEDSYVSPSLPCLLSSFRLLIPSNTPHTSLFPNDQYPFSVTNFRHETPQPRSTINTPTAHTLPWINSRPNRRTILSVKTTLQSPGGLISTRTTSTTGWPMVHKCTNTGTRRVVRSSSFPVDSCSSDNLFSCHQAPSTSSSLVCPIKAPLA